MRIAVADPADPEIVALLQEHLRDMRASSPPESVHALDLDGLRHPSVTVWSVRDDAGLLAIGALKDVGDGHGEIKSMRVAEQRLLHDAAGWSPRHHGCSITELITLMSV